ncbi:RNA-binding domain-containing protein [Schizopora paradoxa]|uniref:Probable RNA-binding protein 18 n=1 Tax=Schizopora paradoxa TaxID=27342 RepID=A0A0H2S6L7_9AGAM|nr:RNA-binding domain-containing protein [Schizopora paradoxa]
MASEDELLATPGASSSNTYISYPTEAPSLPQPTAQTTEIKREVNKNRLYVGNLHSSVDEYTFLNVFSKYGKISKLDFLFHKSGPSKGKARGYAFVEYAGNEDASKALTNAHDKLLRGRKLVVTYANQAPSHDGAPGKYPHRRVDAQRPTALSLIKSSGRPGRTEDKIAALEAKLTQMQKDDKPKPSTLVGHPSLPLKPPAPLPKSVAEMEKSSSKSETSRRNNNADKSRASRAEPMQMSGKGAKSLGKKPTLQELMSSSLSGSPASSQGLFRR